MRTLLLTIYLTAACGAAAIADGHEMQVYYIQFEIETYLATTPANIAERAHHTFTLTDEKAIAQLLKLTSGGKPSRVDTNRIRLLLTMDGGKETRLVDAEGHVTDARTERALTSRTFRELRATMSRLVDKYSKKGAAEAKTSE